MTATVDPFAGSYVIEKMTDDVEAATLELMQKVEDLGGAVNAIEHGFQKNEIERSAYRIAQETDAGERVVVGVNRFQLDEEEPSNPSASTPPSRPSRPNASRNSAPNATRRRSTAPSPPSRRPPRARTTSSTR
ncbi:methylmalonyl-CoA mutase OS=Streptomyces tendae OX=1932 GN=GUR47_16435 PE=4 SV=1 [Streptomyces tendae]